MSPQQEQKLRMQIGLGATMAGALAQMVTSRDPAAGQTVAIALADITGKHWDHYKNVYQTLKGETVGAVGDADQAFTEELVTAILASLRPA